MQDIERSNISALRKQAADKEDLFALHLLDLAEQMPDSEENQRTVLTSLIVFRNKGLGESAARGLMATADKMMVIGILLGKKESPNVPR